MRKSIWDVMEIVACTAREACLGINEPGFQGTVEKCTELVSKAKTSSPLDIFFPNNSMKKQGSLAAQVFASPSVFPWTSLLARIIGCLAQYICISAGCFTFCSASLLVLHSVQGSRLGSSEVETQGARQRSVPLSPLQQAVANSVAGCPEDVMKSLESHLQALGGLKAISASAFLHLIWPTRTWTVIYRRCVVQQHSHLTAFVGVVLLSTEFKMLICLMESLICLRSTVIRLDCFGECPAALLVKRCSITRIPLIRIRNAAPIWSYLYGAHMTYYSGEKFLTGVHSA